MPLPQMQKKSGIPTKVFVILFCILIFEIGQTFASLHHSQHIHLQKLPMDCVMIYSLVFYVLGTLDNEHVQIMEVRVKLWANQLFWRLQ